MPRHERDAYRHTLQQPHVEAEPVARSGGHTSAQRRWQDLDSSVGIGGWSTYSSHSTCNTRPSARLVSASKRVSWAQLSGHSCIAHRCAFNTHEGEGNRSLPFLRRLENPVNEKQVERQRRVACK